ncbi:MAG: regulatory protein RecX [Cellvibrio sp.]
MNNSESGSPITPANVRMAAMNLLSMREHSARELHAKLLKKFQLTELVSAVTQKLQDDGLQSDDRFTEAFVKMRLRQGKGSLVIRAELKEKGIEGILIDKYLANHQDAVDWNQLAFKAHQKKFGVNPINDLKDKARRVRFLTARGFSSANIQHVFKQLEAGANADDD